MKISLGTIFIVSPALLFLSASFIWYLVLYQAIGFFSGFTILIFLIFLMFRQNFLALRRSGELIGLKNKKQISIVSLIFVLGFGELFWSISFLPFSFFILSGIISVIFIAVLDIYKEYFRKSVIDKLKIRKILIRNIAVGIISIIIFILISPWFPSKIY